MSTNFIELKKSEFIPISEEVLMPGIIEGPVKSNEEKNTEGKIPLFFKQNKILLGKPNLIDIQKYLSNPQNRLSFHQKEMLNSHRYFFVEFSCSFIPHRKCEFTWARFSVLLFPSTTNSGDLNEEVIVTQLIPEEAHSTFSFERTLNLSDQFKISIDKLISYEEQGSSINEKKSHIVVEPQVQAFGINTPFFGWEFSASSERKSIKRMYKNLFAMIRVPYRQSIKARFNMEASVSSGNRTIPLITNRRKKKIIDFEYLLIP